MNFKRLKLDRGTIDKTILSYVGKELTPSINKNAGYEIYRYQIDSDAILDIYYNADATTTLCCTGKKPEVSQLVANEIIDHCTLCLPNPIRALYLKGFSQENVDTVLQNIEKKECDINVLNDTAIAKRYEVTNTLGESIKIHYFPATGALNIQGKGYSVYNNILSSFDTLIAIEDVIESNLLANNIENITTEELVKSMKKAFPNSYPFLNGAIANIISSSFFLTKIENDKLADYSWMVFPILRGLEGVIKKLLLLKGIRVNKNFGEVFEPISTGATSYKFKDTHSNTINDAKYCSTVVQCYNYLVSNRHGIFHVDSAINATRLIDRNEAIELFNEVVELIETSHSSVTS